MWKQAALSEITKFNANNSGHHIFGLSGCTASQGSVLLNCNISSILLNFSLGESQIVLSCRRLSCMGSLNPCPVVTKDLIGESWRDTVKECLCLHEGNEPPPPARDDCDIFRGAVSSNHDQVITCSPATSAMLQYLGLPETKAIFAFQRRLVGVVYFKMEIT
jgi:hypothetical protein